jgi:hypothetical protein
MKTPWIEQSFLEKMWMCVKFAFTTPIGYTPTASSTSSSFDDDDNIFSSTSSFMDNDDSPTRGLWDPTSIYYSMMHSDDNSSIHSMHSSLFDD